MQAHASQASGSGGEVSSGRGCRTLQGRSSEISSVFGLLGASTRSVDVYRIVRCRLAAVVSEMTCVIGSRDITTYVNVVE
jgi:hypothetical protein